MKEDRLAFSEAALEVLRQRYLRRDETGQVIESPEAMMERVARAIAAPAGLFGEDERYWEERFFGRMRRLEFLPNSPTLMNAGLADGQLAACFVLPIEDNLESIFTTLGRMARIHQSGGGTGFSFSSLRPRRDRVRSTGGITSGPLSFMDIFDLTTAVIREGGRRRGANMAVLRIDHPDIEEFVEAKLKPGRLENFNLSVGVTDAFFEALERREPFALRNPRTGREVSAVRPEALLEKICAAAWATGDPGLLFLDEINAHNPTPALGRIESTNPCGEQPLLPYESCTLGSLNLPAFLAGGEIDWSALREAVHDGVVFLDNVIEANSYPFPEIEAATRRTRKIGLGVMGLANLFARLGIAYDSGEAELLAEKIAEFLTAEARRCSAALGERRGSFPAFSQSVWPARGFTALRNATVTCVAPTGTISLIAGTSAAIEPFFALAFSRRILGTQFAAEINPLLREELERLGPDGERALEEVRERGSIRDLEYLPAELRRRFPIALEIAPRWHLQMQAAFQKHVDAAVSKTVNLPRDAPPAAVREVFLLARQLRLKGVTIYRYGSRPGQALSLVQEGVRHDCRECAE
ncbi:MAG TPA: adenosylcobalamin-dependent ribonucleoside-diphosphate reductase [candidate division Zixibacteria bacterium]|nr:adenosylcobalamin-dependent ribonucleoside-diphosphate reductase [candidate division Zixibacteria bacterium]